jgi:lipopolysaccharide transport system permease protein
MGALAHFFSDLMRHRELIRELSNMELRAQYKNSFMGLAWLFVLPLINVLMWLLLYQGGVFTPGNLPVPFVLYVMTGSVCWMFFYLLHDSLSRAISGGSYQFLLSEFPRIVIMCQKVRTHLLTLIVPLFLCMLMVPLMGVTFHVTLFLFPLFLTPLLLLAVATGLLFSLLEVVASDAARLVNRLLAASLFITPVAFSAQQSRGILNGLVQINPLTHLIQVPREVLLTGRIEWTTSYLCCSAGALVFFIVSLRTFYAAETRVMERLHV